MMNLCKVCGRKVNRHTDYCYLHKPKKKHRKRKTGQVGSNESENIFEKAVISLGLRAYRSGWPDYLVFNPEDEKIILIEVKKTKTNLRNNQRKMIDMLQKAGLRCEVVKVRTGSPVKQTKVENQLKVLFGLNGHSGN